MNYQEALDYLYTQLPMYQRVGKVAYKKDLKNTLALLKILGDPHRRFKSIHIAGTNGKGTCSHGIASILQLSGYKTGLYTSPHLKNFTERIKINGQEVSEEFVVYFMEKTGRMIADIQPSFFELTVTMAFEYFAQMQVDIAVIETGLGGRLDSTNVIAPEACLITNIGYDHMDMLGDSLKKIAFEKAGIIKPNTPIVIGEYHSETFPIFAEKAAQEKAKLLLCHDFNEGSHLIDFPYTKQLNYEKVKTLSYVLNDVGWHISDHIIDKAIAEMEILTGLKGRCQVLSHEPLVIADIAHNVEGLTAFFTYMKRQVRTGELHIIFGSVKEKELEPILSLFPANSLYYWTQSSVPRSIKANDLSQRASAMGLHGKTFKNVNQALAAAKKASKPKDATIVTGSTFIVADLEDL